MENMKDIKLSVNQRTSKVICLKIINKLLELKVTQKKWNFIVIVCFVLFSVVCLFDCLICFLFLVIFPGIVITVS